LLSGDFAADLAGASAATDIAGIAVHASDKMNFEKCWNVVPRM
jgi:hypothetical protein